MTPIETNSPWKTEQKNNFFIAKSKQNFNFQSIAPPDRLEEFDYYSQHT